MDGHSLVRPLLGPCAHPGLQAYRPPASPAISGPCHNTSHPRLDQRCRKTVQRRGLRGNVCRPCALDAQGGKAALSSGAAGGVTSPPSGDKGH